MRAPPSVLNEVQFPGPLGPVSKVEEPKIHPKSGTVAVGMANVVQTVMRTVPLPQEADIRGQRGPRNCLYGGRVGSWCRDGDRSVETRGSRAHRYRDREDDHGQIELSDSNVESDSGDFHRPKNATTASRHAISVGRSQRGHRGHKEKSAHSAQKNREDGSPYVPEKSTQVPSGPGALVAP